jgi:hypothetical protein
MADNRESDLLAYILGVLVIAISGIAVGVASNTPPASTDNPNSATESASNGVAAAEVRGVREQ